MRFIFQIVVFFVLFVGDADDDIDSWALGMGWGELGVS